MNSREAFKVGFLARCINDGFTQPAEIDGLLKRAEGGFLGKLVGNASSLGLGLALAGPPLVGAVGGYLAAKAKDVGEADVDDMKDQEVLDTYRNETARIQREAALRRRLASAPRRY